MQNVLADIEAAMDILGPHHAMSLEAWDEDGTPFRRALYLDAGTYQVERLFDVPPAVADQECGNYVLSPRGKWAYRSRILPEERPLSLQGKRGFVVFNGDVVLPTLIDLGLDGRTGERFPYGLSQDYRATWGAVWMSLTPGEMLTQRSGVQAAQGTVVIGGLGLGWLLRKVCEKETVERVIVVEKSQELLEWYGTRFCARYEKVSDVICDDVYNQLGKHGPAKYLLDIWPIYQGARQDPRLRAARRKLGRRLGAWGIN